MIIHLVVNPNAGSRQGERIAREATKTLQDAGYTVVQHLSRALGETLRAASSAAREIAGSGAPGAVIAVGGDGTLFEVLNGVYREQMLAHIPVGQIPVGTGNSFIRDLNIQGTEDAVTAIVRGHTRQIDVGTLSCEAGEFVFINLLGAGFVSAVAHGAQRYKGWGSLSYVLAVLQETIRLQSRPFTLTIDGVPQTEEGIFVEICNSRYTGGAMLMAPEAIIDDGLLDVVYMTRAHRRKVLSLFPRIFAGTHVEDPVIHHLRCSRVTLTTPEPWPLTPDGETFGTTPLSARIIAQGVSVFAP